MTQMIVDHLYLLLTHWNVKMLTLGLWDLLSQISLEMAWHLKYAPPSPLCVLKYRCWQNFSRGGFMKKWELNLVLKEGEVQEGVSR